VAEEMASEDQESASTDDIQGEDDPEDSVETEDPEDDVPDFIDEIEVANITAPIVKAPVLPNPNYDPKCPGLHPRRCKQKGDDDTHKRRQLLKKRNKFMFRRGINNK
jgi:hypothetical protein